MVEIARICLEFIIVFLVVFVLSYIFSLKKTGKYNRKKLPLNVNYLFIKYKLDIVKIGYKKILKTLIYVDSFIVSLLFTVTRFIDNVYIRLLVCFILVFPLFAGVYHLVAKYYEKESD